MRPLGTYSQPLHLHVERLEHALVDVSAHRCEVRREMTEPARPTADEIRRVNNWQKQRRCIYVGHEFEVVLSGFTPTCVRCARCGDSWDVKPHETETET